MSSQSRTLTYAGQTFSLTAWSRLLGIPRSTLSRRYRQHPDWCAADLLGVCMTTYWRGRPVVGLAQKEGECQRFLPDFQPCPAYGDPEGQERPCPHCGLVAGPWTPDGEMAPDPCLGWLPGVRYACCGHGHRTTEACRPYVVLATGARLEGPAALAYFADKGCQACL